MTDFERIRSEIDSYCGLSCGECPLRESTGCGGCIATKGRPFHGECGLAQCAIERKRGFCGESPDFPCKLLQDYSHDLEHGDDPPGRRIERCGRLKAGLVAAARAGVDPQGVCGHHCDHCPYTKYCGGCRGVYNNCSYGTLYEDGVCPNVSCARERGLDGCYDCPELDGCGKGYFGAEDGHTAKDAARSIRERGKKAHAEGLAGA